MLPIVTLDFETDPIQQRPAYPPKPCGLSVRRANGDTRYLAFGHPSGNNAVRDDALGDESFDTLSNRHDALGGEVMVATYSPPKEEEVERRSGVKGLVRR